MSYVFQRVVGFGALLASSLATAAPVSLGQAGSYNLVSFGDFNSSNNSIAGSVAVADDFMASSFSLNGKSLVVGSDLAYSNGSIAGDAYVGGTRSTSGVGMSGKWLTGDAPLDFAALERQMDNLSLGLVNADTTGTSKSQYGGLYLIGTQSDVEVFSLQGSQLSANGWSDLSGLLPGASIIFNIGGSDIKLSNGMLGGLSDYNVLYNFYEAQTITLQSVSLQGSLLAPFASIYGDNGNIAGTVVAADWFAGITLGAGSAFRTTEVAGYQAPATSSRTFAALAEVNAVPEPGNLALVAMALGLLATVQRKRGIVRQAAVAA